MYDNLRITGHDGCESGFAGKELEPARGGRGRSATLVGSLVPRQLGLGRTRGSLADSLFTLSGD